MGSWTFRVTVPRSSVSMQLHSCNCILYRVEWLRAQLSALWCSSRQTKRIRRTRGTSSLGKTSLATRNPNAVRLHRRGYGNSATISRRAMTIQSGDGFARSVLTVAGQTLIRRPRVVRRTRRSISGMTTRSVTLPEDGSRLAKQRRRHHRGISPR